MDESFAFSGEATLHKLSHSLEQAFSEFGVSVGVNGYLLQQDGVVFRITASRPTNIDKLQGLEDDIARLLAVPAVFCNAISRVFYVAVKGCHCGGGSPTLSDALRRAPVSPLQIIFG